MFTVLALWACVAPETTDETLPAAPESPFEGCPVLVPGSNEFVSADLRRRVVVYFPESGIEPGMPVQYVFHGRGQRAENMVGRGDLQRLAEQQRMVTVAPDSVDRDGRAWLATPDSRDLALFDEVTRCLVEGYGADPDQIHVSGFSGGGLFTTWLILHRSDRLASAITFSGGLDATFFPYETPAVSIPVLVVWGGEDDSASAGSTLVNFEALSQRFAELLRNDGHLVGTCDHGNGHRVPSAMPLLLENWSLRHVRGQPSPFPAAAEDLPDYCSFEDTD